MHQLELFETHELPYPPTGPSTAHDNINFIWDSHLEGFLNEAPN